MSNTTVTAPQGFLAAGVRCGIKQADAMDLGLIACVCPAVAAAIFTTNRVFAAPVALGRAILPKGRGQLEAVVVNSGNANACTGAKGLRDARRMAALTAQATVCPVESVLVSSTGIIGRPLPMERVERGIIMAAAGLGDSPDHGHAFARAIMTTDTRPKEAFATLKIGRARVCVAGCTKGAGMIAPNMATMLAYVTTDAAVSPALLHAALAGAAADTFNAISVDGHTSTNDTLAVLASGLADHPPIRTRGADFRKFADALGEVCRALADAIVRDGEGATKLVRVTVSGAASPADARRAARAIADSPLAKCALHGADPNWGRFTSAAGYSGARCDPAKMRCAVGGVTIFRGGQPARHDVKKVARLMAADTVDVTVVLGIGKSAVTITTCDLSKEYVTINADYHT